MWGRWAEGLGLSANLGSDMAAQIKETAGGEFRVYRAS